MADLMHTFKTLIAEARMPHAIALVGGSKDSRLAVAGELIASMGCAENTGSLLNVEADGVQIKLEQAKIILDFLSLARLVKTRAVVIHEAQNLNPQAANALLKIIEEPPEKSFFICLLPSLSLVMPTLQSRLQAFRLPFAREDRGHDPELVSVVERAWEGLLKRDRGLWNELVSEVKDRDAALQLAQIFQLQLRKAVVESSQPQLLSQTFRWWKAAFQLEQDISANLDRTLLFENFYYQAYRP